MLIYGLTSLLSPIFSFILSCRFQAYSVSMNWDLRQHGCVKYLFFLPSSCPIILLLFLPFFLFSLPFHSPSLLSLPSFSPSFLPSFILQEDNSRNRYSFMDESRSTAIHKIFNFIHWIFFLIPRSFVFKTSVWLRP